EGANGRRRPMSWFHRHRWWLRIGLPLILSLSLVLSMSSAAWANPAVRQLSSDPYTNPKSQHRTEVEPDTFAFGSTIISAFQVGRFFNGGASNIGFTTSHNGGRSWVNGFLPGTTGDAMPANPK